MWIFEDLRSKFERGASRVSRPARETNEEKMQPSQRLKKQLLNSLVVSAIFSIVVFVAALLIIGPYLNLLTMLIMMSGGVLGIWLNTRNPVNPLYFAPLWQRNLRMTREEVIAFLMPYWKKFPRYWLYLTLLIYMLPFMAIYSFFGGAENASVPYIIASFIMGIML